MLRKRLMKYLLVLLVLLISISCRQSIQPLVIPTISNYSPAEGSARPALPASTKTVPLPVIRQVNDTTISTPTPDQPKVLPTLRSQEEQYIVQVGDALGVIANRFNITVQMLINANQIPNPDLLEVGQVLTIPAPVPGEQGIGSKIIPDSELVYGPMAGTFDVEKFVSQYDSYLGRYTGDMEGYTLSGPEIVMQVAHDYSVNPRLLLAVLEYQSGWVTLANPEQYTQDNPIGLQDTYRKGLYSQLAWVADNLNKGYYLWKANAISGWLLTSGEIIPVDPTINAGTAAVQELFSLLYDRSGWDRATSASGLYATYNKLFGYPFDYAVIPLIPDGLTQPAMQLPFEPGVDWVFTGGPHGGWGEGSAWAALDFAPGNEGLGCVEYDLWVVAVADGLIVRADKGRVIQDLDGDGNEGTGWEVLYMHIEARDRVQPGTYLKAGDRIGHPSCEGGYSTGTHFHLARRYNGEWIPADQTNGDTGVPFNLEGWVSSGDGIEYDGYLKRDGDTVEAWEGYYPENTIHR